MLPKLTFGSTCFGLIGLRPHLMTDVNDLVLSANNAEIVKYALDSFPNPYTVSDAQDYLILIMARDPRPHFAITASDKLIGGLGFERGVDVERYSSVITYWLGRQYWGHGIATMVVNGVCDYAFEHTDIVRLSARVFDGNSASERILEKCGFVKEAILRKSIFKNGTFMDGHLYAKIKE
ncbi:MAG: GNAT family protein [Parcubacteria group bacterium]